jgi:hypothetical protein
MTNICVIDEYHRSIIDPRPFATVFPAGSPQVADEEDDTVEAKVVRRPRSRKVAATEGVETK